MLACIPQSRIARKIIDGMAAMGTKVHLYTGAVKYIRRGCADGLVELSDADED